MAWIRVDATIGENPKLFQLADRLDMEVPHVVGHLTLLWAWMSLNAWDGRLKKVPDGVIERAAQWRGEKAKFALAIRDYLCDKRTGEMSGWVERQGKLVQWMQRNSARKRDARAGQNGDGSGTGAGRPGDNRENDVYV